ncbi:MAG TPA: hypothetical protein VLA21_00885, partial [Candidatus Limnocylindria bacterium]|nr:hypothetical protein [Candidatus Limnocylindria bacterium]
RGEGSVSAGSCIFVIVTRGRAEALLHAARRAGARRATVLLGEGTAGSRVLEWLGISQTFKEVVLLAVPGDAEDAAYEMLRGEFSLHRRYRGVAFSVPYSPFDPEDENWQPPEHPAHAHWACLPAVVERGLGHECMKAARAAGAAGGTILQGHGAGVPRDYFFPLNWEPQKDLVMMVVPEGIAAAVASAVAGALRTEHTGMGLVFALPVTRSIGLYEDPKADGQGPA